MDPVSLKMLEKTGMCMFCETPEGGVKTNPVCLNISYGFYSCEKPECINKSLDEHGCWYAEKAWNEVYYLKDNTNLKIKRSNGNVEEGWAIHSPVVLKDDYNHDIILCISGKIKRWSIVDMLREQNPIDVQSHYIPYIIKNYINKCIECGVNMGELNPRQYCGKYCCDSHSVYYEIPERVQDNYFVNSISNI